MPVQFLGWWKYTDWVCTQALEADFIAHHVLQDNVRTNIRRTYLYYVQDLHMYIHTDACKHARMHAITLHYV